MPICRAFLVLFFVAAAGRGAELRTLKGEAIKGDLAGITDKEVVIRQDGKEVKTPIKEILQVEFGPVGKLPPDVKYCEVELTDGTLLHCKKFALAGKQAELPLLSGQTVRVPLAVVSHVVNDAQDGKNRKEWAARTANKKRTRDLMGLVVKDGDNPQGTVKVLSGTFGEGGKDGTSIRFALRLGERTIARDYPLERVHAMIFVRTLDPSAPPVLCKLYDTYQDLVMVSGMKMTPAGLTVTTPAGATIDYARELVARLDYSSGNQAFLSDLTPSKVVEQTPTEEHYRRDLNVNGRPMTLLGKTYPKGLGLHATTELEYDLNGEYREFRAVVGIDDAVGGHDGPVQLTVEADGKEIVSLTLMRKDHKVHELVRNVKDVQKLRIVVCSPELLDLGKHLDLAEARVIK